MAAVIAVSVASLVAFASLGGVGFAQTAAGLGQYQYGKKVTICHKGKNTIRISVRAWPAHKRHGDVLGTCAQAKKAHAKKLHAKKVHAKAQDKKAEQAGAATAKKGNEKSNGKSGK